MNVLLYNGDSVIKTNTAFVDSRQARKYGIEFPWFERYSLISELGAEVAHAEIVNGFLWRKPLIIQISKEKEKGSPIR